MLRPFNLTNVNAFKLHFPQRTHVSQFAHMLNDLVMWRLFTEYSLERRFMRTWNWVESDYNANNGEKCSPTLSTVVATSCSVVKRPTPKRMEEWARSSCVPMALRTYEGSREADVQADPDDKAISLRAINKLSPSIYANERFTQPG